MRRYHQSPLCSTALNPYGTTSNRTHLHTHTHTHTHMRVHSIFKSTISSYNTSNQDFIHTQRHRDHPMTFFKTVIMYISTQPIPPPPPPRTRTRTQTHVCIDMNTTCTAYTCSITHTHTHPHAHHDKFALEPPTSLCRLL